MFNINCLICKTRIIIGDTPHFVDVGIERFFCHTDCFDKKTFENCFKEFEKVQCLICFSAQEDVRDSGNIFVSKYDTLAPFAYFHTQCFLNY